MLNQFRTRYPKGCLTSELLLIEHGKYIVKVFVQVDGITVATGLAASETVEQAEDLARIRALAVLNLDSTTIPLASENPSPTQSASIAPELSQGVLHSQSREEPGATQLHPLESPTIQAEVPNESPATLTKPIQEVQLPQNVAQFRSAKRSESSENGSKKGQMKSAPVVDHSDLLTGMPNEFPTSSPPINEPSVNQANELPLLGDEPVSPASSRVGRVAKTSSEEPLLEEKIEDELSGVRNEFRTEPDSLPPEEPTPDLKTPATTQPDRDILPVESEITPVVTTASTPPIESRDNSSAERVLHPNETLDFSDIMARSNAQIKRLKWTTEQGRDYLLKTYGKKSRHLLNDQELLEFLNYLESLPTP